MIATAVLLFIAGFETTTNLIGNGLLALLQNPAELARSRDDPSLAPLAVDELLRWDSPVQLNIRVALEDADIAGEPLVTGTPVLILQGSANRDEAHYKDADVFDVARPDNVPMSFGWGIHHCIGTSLAPAWKAKSSSTNSSAATREHHPALRSWMPPTAAASPRPPRPLHPPRHPHRRLAFSERLGRKDHD